MDTTTSSSDPRRREPGNKGKLVGQKAPFKPKDIWAMRMRLQQEHRSRDLALLNVGLDSKLRACDLVSLKVRDISHGEHVASRACGTPVHRPVSSARQPMTGWFRVTAAGRLHRRRMTGNGRTCRSSERPGRLQSAMTVGECCAPYSRSRAH